jgi:nitrogen fixation/metabolism regulation signal transduction histidine kinase
METAFVEFPEEPKPEPRPFFRRRQFLIDRKGQLLTTAKIAGVVSVLLVLLNLVFLLWNTTETQAVLATNPELAEELKAIDQRSALVLAIVSLAVLGTVIVRSIRLTHRTAGAAFNLERCIKKVAAGEYDTTLKVRRKDNLQDLQGPFNLMVASLRRRAIEDHAALEELAGRIEEIGHLELAEEVRNLARAKAKLADPTL